MSLNSDLTAIKDIQDGVKNNKVTRFAYTQTAYNNNDVNGHDDYVATRDNNIPLSDLSVIEVNPTVVDKGFRARASALNRMFLNHLFGRISYNLNKINDLFNDLLVKIVANLGVANGLATLDATGRIPYSQLPEDAMEYQGDWDAQTNTPTLADGTGTKGDTYNVTVAGTQTFGDQSIHFYVGDRIVYNGSVWQRFSSGDVRSVCEILPDPDNANVDLTKQTDITKILPIAFLNKLLGGFFWNPVRFTSGELVTNIQGIAYGNNTFVAVIGSNTLSYSIDGKEWTNSFANRPQWEVIFGGGLFVAVIKPSSNYYPVWSEDGINWTVEQSLNLGGEPEDIVYAGNEVSVTYKWVICCGTKGMFCSTNGKTWESCTGLNSSNKFTGACFGKVTVSGGTQIETWIAFGLSSSGYCTYYRSTNGKSWTSMGSFSAGSGNNFNVTAVFAQGMFVTNNGYWSTDGYVFNVKQSGTIASSFQDMKATYQGGRFFTKTASSADGKNWITYSPTLNFVTVVYGDGIYVASTNSANNVYKSLDGINWYPALGNKVATTVRRRGIYAKGIFIMPSSNDDAYPSRSSIQDLLTQE